MNQTFLTRLTPALLGAVTLATVGIPQAAQAGTISARSEVDFTNVTLQLIDNDGSGDGIGNLFLPVAPLGYDGSFAEVDASGAINGIDPVDAVGPVACANTPITTIGAGSEFPFSLAGGTINAGASVDCSGIPATASNFAQIDLTAAPGDPPISGFAQGEYEVFSDDFEATAGDVVDLDGFVAFDLFAEVTGFDGGTKIASAEFEAQYTINRIIDGIVTEVFAGSVFSGGVAVTNEDGQEILNNTTQEIADPFPLSSPDFDYIIPEGADGTYEIRLAAVEQVTGAIDREKVPEPSSLAGLLALGGLTFLVKRRKNH